MAVETTLVLVKPDGVRRGLIHQVVGRIEAKGLKIVGLKLLVMSSDLADKHYHAHVEKKFYPELKAFMTGGPVAAIAVRGDDAIAHVRNIMGATRPAEATPGSLRGDFCTTVTENLVHGSDGAESAAYELGLWFKAGEIMA